MKKGEWYQKDLLEVFRDTESSKEGITTSEAKKRLREHPNTLKKGKKTTALGVLLNQFKSYIIYVLLFADIVAYLTHEIPEVIVISIILVLAIVIGFLQEYKASKEMEALRNLTPKKAKVIREGKEQEIVAEELTIGDVIILDRGDMIPADARIIECNSLNVDESALTGESVPVSKKEGNIKGKTQLAEQYNMVFAATVVTSGNAKAVVVEVGKETEIGKVSSMLADVKEEKTPLQKRLDKLGKVLAFVVFGICIAISIIGYVRGEEIHNILLLAVAVAVSGIPESLPTTMAVTLALGVKRMAKRDAIVKKLPSVETLGTCTVICSDKTGTLTQNRMVIEKIITADVEAEVTGSGFTPKGFFIVEGKRINPKKHKTLSKFLEIGIFCNNSDLKRKGSGWDIEGEPTEGALTVVAKKAGLEKSELHIKFPRVKEHPFDPVRKCMSTVHKMEKKHLVYSKGAPELLLKKASYYLFKGKERKLTEKVREDIIKKNEEYANKGMRVLGLAFKEHNAKKLELKHVESKLVFVGLAVMRDPPETHAKESVKLCHEAGTKVVMITGDNKVTAQAIATDLGIFREHQDLILEGSELEDMPEEKFEKMVDRVTVYARATPKHKLRIVTALQKKGHIVAMTGDGVNDAPAIKKADIGIAMGKRGTDVVKESGVMILKDDNFSTIVSAMQEGRTIYSNIRKFIYYALTTNITEVMLILIATLISANPLLTTLMILYLNLVTGNLPSLGLSVDPSTGKEMKEMPRDPKENILGELLLFKIANVVPIMVLVTIGLYNWELIINQSSVAEAETVAFVTLIFFELFQIFIAKSGEESALQWKSLSNVYLNGAVIFALLFTFLAVYFPPLAGLLGTVPLSAFQVAVIFVATSSLLLYTEVQKTFVNAEIRERERKIVRSV